jgi:maltose alpha-D-glucosyltransferase/alpha-amylase
MQSDGNLQYSDYYIWAPVKPEDLTQQEASRFVGANAPRAKYYIKNYYDCQPALNYGYANPNPDHPLEQPVNAPGPQAMRSDLQRLIQAALTILLGLPENSVTRAVKLQIC